MKAVIFNSGLGKRMGDLTKNNPKCMVRLSNGESIFERQIRLLSEEGIKDFLITTGPFEEQLKEIVSSEHFKNLNFTFVNNPIYDKTNYIYSMFLAKEHFNDDVLMLHGDLVFNRKLVKDIFDDTRTNLATVYHNKNLPGKDFKARIVNGYVREVSINIFDDDCFAFQPMYKLSCDTISKWLDEVSNFVSEGVTEVYAENAFNKISNELSVEEFLCDSYFIDEVDNEEDLKRVSEEIKYFDYREQNIIQSSNYEQELKELLEKYAVTKIFIVAENFFETSDLKKILEKLKIPYIFYNKFSSNPKYEEVVEGVELFCNEKCDYIISYGGGSALDVAKCIKLFYGLNHNENYLAQHPKFNLLKHLAIPTTAGTGSESTKFAVVYENGIKQSVMHDSIIPDDVILDSRVLKTLPLYQKKSTMMDALCQGIESYWSVNSTEESKKYAKKSIELILKNYKNYINGDESVHSQMFLAANYSGKAINISQTTAAHAMSYKMSSMYGISHGHAVVLSMPALMRYMCLNLDKCVDPRGKEYLENVFNEINNIFGTNSLCEASDFVQKMITELELLVPKATEHDIKLFANSVNKQRLKNNPVDINDVSKLYKEILK